MEVQNHYIIKDLQTGELSHITTVELLFEICSDDYLMNDWNDTERARIEAEFEAMDHEAKKEWVAEVYEYRFDEPTLELIEEWEEENGKKFSDQTC